MPRAPKRKEAVIPTNSLVASAARYSGKSARIFRPNQDWQRECYRHYSICGEARFAARFFGHAMSRAELGMGTRSAGGKVEPTTEGVAADHLADLFNGKDGQEQMLEALGLHLTIAGECYLVGRTVVTEDESGFATESDVWEIVSIMEMQVSGEKWTINYGDGMAPVTLNDDDVVIRIWVPNPEKRMEADSPFRSLLPILTEIEWLTRHVFAQVSSRLAGSGILFLPQGMSFPPPPEIDGQQQQVANEADSFMLTLADAMLTPITDPGAVEATVPTVVTAPGDEIDKAKLMHFWSNLDEHALTLRQEAIRRFALGMELPPEQVLGMSSNSGTGGGTSNGVSHWGAWQIEESTIKMFIEPMLELIVNALTIGYIRPLTGNVADVVTYSTASLRMRPDRSKEAMELYALGLVKAETVLRENGFDPSDAMDDEERKTWLLVKAASGSATPDQVGAALRMLGVDMPVTDPGQEPREARPTPSLEEHPSRPRTPLESGALLAASEALVFRALERCGNPIRQRTGVKPPGVASYEMHTLTTANGSADSYLEDAWSCAPQVLDGIAEVEPTVQTLNAYVKALLAENAPHTRARLQEWLEVAS